MCYAYMYMYFVRILRNHHYLWGDQPMFMAFMGKPCIQIYIHTKLYTIICLIFIRIILIALPMKLCPHEPQKCWLPMNIDPHKEKMIPL